MRKQRSYSIIPGFSMTLGYTMLYVSILVMLPLTIVIWDTLGLSWQEFYDIVMHPHVVASYKLGLSAALAASVINILFGTLIAWLLVRCPFRGKEIIEALIDLPFALPTAVAGISLTSLYAVFSWLGQFFNVNISFTPVSILIALTFIGLPFVVRTVQPVLQYAAVVAVSADETIHYFLTFSKVIVPKLLLAIVTGFLLAFARALGEYGSIILIIGNLPMHSETPLIMMTTLEQYDYAGVTAIATFMLVGALILLFIVNTTQWAMNRKFSPS